MKKASKSLSGVLVITVLTSPWPELPNGKKQKFSCQWNCYYCPNEPGQPRSYLHDEPAVMRANQNGFDPVLQFHDRAATLACNGHPIDKIEILVLGGTWSSYPEAYRETFVRDLFFSANTFYERKKRPRRSLLEEKLENETAQCKIIGVTLETRPDTIDFHELQLLRSYGCTRVQLGLQHTEDHVLKKVNRGCTNADAMRAIELLKNAGFKVDIHLMPVLPGSSAEDDGRMFDRVLTDPNLQADQWKIYPTQVSRPWVSLQRAS
jgi:ELP3 family radical SAM enzyme/protein acetyltransferase